MVNMGMKRQMIERAPATLTVKSAITTALLEIGGVESLGESVVEMRTCLGHGDDAACL